MNRLPMSYDTVAGMIHFDSTTVAGAASELISTKTNCTDFSFHFTKWKFGSAPEAVKVERL